MRITQIAAVSTLCFGLLVNSTAPASAGEFQKNHPRRAEVLGRDRHMNGAINRDKGRLGGNYGGLEAEQRGIHAQERADARANGGHITRQEQHQLNGEENTLHQQVNQDYKGKGNAFGYGHGRGGDFAQDHPRRAEVLGRDGNLNNSINRDKGDLGGNYGALKADDHSIRQQERADARANGGYITNTQKQQLNQEENQLRKQVNQDHQ